MRSFGTCENRQSRIFPLDVIVKLQMTNGIQHLGTLRFDSAMVYHSSHTSVKPLQIVPISPSLRICISTCICRYENWRRGDGISRWSPRMFPRVLPVWGSILPVWGSPLPILSHMGLGRRTHQLGIRHMVNKVGFVISWLES